MCIMHNNKTKPVHPGKKKKHQKRTESTPGPKPDILKLEGDWQENIKKSLSKKKPPEGWPS